RRTTGHTSRRWNSPPAITTQPPLLDLPGDHHALDLAGAFPDAVDADVAVQPLDRVLAHVAAAAQDLHRLVDHAAGHLGGIELQRRGAGVLHLLVEAGVQLGADAVDHALGREQLDR